MSRLVVDGVVVDTFSSPQPNGQAALFCNGLPGAIGPLPGVLLALESGFDVVFAQYPGTYDSDGEFSVSATADALARVLAACASGGARDMASGAAAPPLAPITAAIGHSFGAYILLNLLRRAPQAPIRRLLLLAPITDYSRDPDSGLREALLDHLDSVRRTRPVTYRIPDSPEWRQIDRGGHPTEKSGDWAGDILALAGTADDTFDFEVFPSAFTRDVVAATGATSARLSVIDGAGHGMDELLRDPREAAAFLQGVRQ